MDFFFKIASGWKATYFQKVLRKRKANPIINIHIYKRVGSRDGKSIRILEAQSSIWWHKI